MIYDMQPKQETRLSAILLIGPTGSGKTPLGQLMQERGLWGLRCLHFDFGHELRMSVSQGNSVLSESEREIVRLMLRTGALLEDEHFPIASQLLEDFISRNRADLNTLIVLNGLPRHEGQAERMQDIVRVMAVISLECSPESVIKRIATDAGGDRAGRSDDSLEEVQRKLVLFRERTAPLLDYYRARHVGIIEVEVGPCSAAAETLEKIENLRKHIDTGPLRN
jgi:adenylate kinase family enzyme